MTPKTGRPTDSPRNSRVGIRLSDEEFEKLMYCTEKLNKSKTDILIIGLDKVYEELKNNDHA